MPRVQGPARYLTREEAGFIEAAAESWLRMREIEFNLGEYAAALLAQADVREEGCARRDLATLDRTIVLLVAADRQPFAARLVRPTRQDPGRDDVSILSELGLACIGQVVGSEIRTSRIAAKFVGFADDGPPASCGLHSATDDHPESMPLQQMVSTTGEASAAFASQALLDALSRPGSYRIFGHGRGGGQILAANELALAHAQWVLRQVYGSSLLFGIPAMRQPGRPLPE